jgi:hypothetical protein
MGMKYRESSEPGETCLARLLAMTERHRPKIETGNREIAAHRATKSTSAAPPSSFLPKTKTKTKPARRTWYTLPAFSSFTPRTIERMAHSTRSPSSKRTPSVEVMDVKSAVVGGISKVQGGTRRPTLGQHLRRLPRHHGVDLCATRLCAWRGQYPHKI